MGDKTALIFVESVCPVCDVMRQIYLLDCPERSLGFLVKTPNLKDSGSDCLIAVAKTHLRVLYWKKNETMLGFLQQWFLFYTMTNKTRKTRAGIRIPSGKSTSPTKRCVGTPLQLAAVRCSELGHRSEFTFMGFADKRHGGGASAPMISRNQSRERAIERTSTCANNADTGPC
jgi:hypothetical protein